MRTKEKVLDDLAHIAGGAINIVNSINQNIREEAKTHADNVAQRLDLIAREDFDRLEAKVEALEKRLKEITKSS